MNVGGTWCRNALVLFAVLAVVSAQRCPTGGAHVFCVNYTEAGVFSLSWDGSPTFTATPALKVTAGRNYTFEAMGFDPSNGFQLTTGNTPNFTQMTAGVAGTMPISGTMSFTWVPVAGSTVYYNCPTTAGCGSTTAIAIAVAVAPTLPRPGLTLAQVRTITDLAFASGFLSLMGTICVLVTFYVLKLDRNDVVNYSVFWLTVCDFFASLSFVVGAGYTLNNGIGSLARVPGLCTTQAIFLQFFLIAADGWSLLIAAHLYRILVLQEKELGIPVWSIHTIIWTCALVLLIGPWSMNMFGLTGGWCWITAQYLPYQQYFFYIFMYITFFTMAILYIRISVEVYRHLGMGKHLQPGKEVENEKRMNRTVARLLYFPLCFLVTWIPGIVNRLQNLSEPTNPIFVLICFHSFFTPLQGFLNSVVYAWTGSVGAKLKAQYEGKFTRSGGLTPSVGQSLPPSTV